MSICLFSRFNCLLCVSSWIRTQKPRPFSTTDKKIAFVSSNAKVAFLLIGRKSRVSLYRTQKSRLGRRCWIWRICWIWKPFLEHKRRHRKHARWPHSSILESFDSSKWNERRNGGEISDFYKSMARWKPRRLRRCRWRRTVMWNWPANQLLRICEDESTFLSSRLTFPFLSVQEDPDNDLTRGWNVQWQALIFSFAKWREEAV